MKNNELIQAAMAVWSGDKTPITVRFSAGETIKKALEPYGFVLEEIFITDSDLRHIKRRHGLGEDGRGQTDVTPEDIGLIPFIVNEFDSIEELEADKLGNVKFLITKQIENQMFLVTIKRGKRKLEVKTMWKK